MIISAIVAVSKNKAIGVQNKLPWHLPSDLQFFKKTTSGHCIIMGRKSFDSIGKPLPNRTNIVITKQKDWEKEGVLVAHSIEQALEIATQLQENEAFIIGGGEIYKQSMSYIQRWYISEVDVVIDNADTFLPDIDFTNWTIKEQQSYPANDKNKYDYTLTILENHEI